MLKRVALMCVLLFVPAGAVLADFKSGLTAYNKGDFETAVKEWQGPAEQGHAQALNGLGFLYMNGQGVAQDDTRALGYFLIAAKRDFTAASTTPASCIRASRARCAISARPANGS